MTAMRRQFADDDPTWVCEAFDAYKKGDLPFWELLDSVRSWEAELEVYNIEGLTGVRLGDFSDHLGMSPGTPRATEGFKDVAIAIATAATSSGCIFSYGDKKDLRDRLQRFYSAVASARVAIGTHKEEESMELVKVIADECFFGDLSGLYAGLRCGLPDNERQYQFPHGGPDSHRDAEDALQRIAKDLRSIARDVILEGEFKRDLALKVMENNCAALVAYLNHELQKGPRPH